MINTSFYLSKSVFRTSHDKIDAYNHIGTHTHTHHTLTDTHSLTQYLLHRLLHDLLLSHAMGNLKCGISNIAVAICTCIADW